MSGIITICGRRFECVPGENLLREIKPGSKRSTVASSLDNGSETSTERKALLSLTSLLADFDGSPLRLLASVAAFSTCFALLLAPPHLFRPVAATQEHVNASQKAENHWYSSGTSTNVSSNLRPSSAPETTSVVMQDNKPPVEETSVTETTSLDVKLDDSAKSNRIEPATPEAKIILTSSEPEGRLRDIARAQDAEEVQQRLASLGYYFGSPAAAWGQRSREALRAFKKINELGPNATWDEPTEVALFSPTARKAASFVGTWAEDEDACLSVPAVIRREGARAGNTFCAFGDAKLVEGVWNVAATCSDPRQRWTVNVRLSVAGDRLTWASQRGSQNYVRCPRELVAQAR